MLKYRVTRFILAPLPCAIALCLSSPAMASAAPLLYVYKGAGCTGRDKLPEFEGMIGRPVDGIADFLAFNSWKDMHNAATWVLGCWSTQKGPLSLSIPMLTTSGTTLQQGAAGVYDDQFRKLAEILVKGGQADAYLRIGIEFNGNWFPWAAQKDPESFRQYFRRIAQAMRSVDGAQFRIVWNPASGADGASADKVYPGDDVVDIIGLDFYNQSWLPEPQTPEQRWQWYLKQPYGLNWLKTFATAHNKPIAFPEWGTGKRPDGHGGGDDPLFVRNTAAWIKANNVAYHVYWDYKAPDYNAQLSSGQYPASASAFVEEFGRAAEPK